MNELETATADQASPWPWLAPWACKIQRQGSFISSAGMYDDYEWLIRV